MTRPRRTTDFVAAALLAGLAVVISPVGIELYAHRATLSLRVNTISLTCVTFLIAIIVALLARGRLRHFFFHVIAWVTPFFLLAGVEALAMAIHLADRIAPLEIPSAFARKTPWPGHLLSDARYYTTPDGLRLYRPWHGDGITINKLGLRTAMPSSKKPGEWHIAITGGSAVWGEHVLDADTIAVRLQRLLRNEGYPNVSVYNFGIEGVTLDRELRLLKEFRKTYEIDQVLFYTGGNNVVADYFASIRKRGTRWLATDDTFELIKAFVRLMAISRDPSPETLKMFDRQLLPSALKSSTLHRDLVAAIDYCRAEDLRCDFALQPLLLLRNEKGGREWAMANSLARVYPRLREMTSGMYRDALVVGPSGHIFDLAHIFDGTDQPIFADLIHTNEAGNYIAANYVAPIVAAEIPAQFRLRTGTNTSGP